MKIRKEFKIGLHILFFMGIFIIISYPISGKYYIFQPIIVIFALHIYTGKYIIPLLNRKSKEKKE